MTKTLTSPQTKVSRLREFMELKDSEDCERIAVLMAVLLGLTENTWNGDVVELSLYRAKDICSLLEIPEGTVDDTLRKFGIFSKIVRQNNPMARAFFGE